MLSLSGSPVGSAPLPSGFSGSFSPSSSITPLGSAIADISVDGTVGVGSYTIYIIGTNGSNTHDFPVVINVTSGSGEHFDCQNNSCVQVSGSGPDRCSTNADCGGSGPGGGDTYAVCSQNACVNMAGTGQSTCSSDANCGGSGITHLECQNNSCLVVGGGGKDQCTAPGIPCGSGSGSNLPPTCTPITTSLSTVIPPESAALSWSCTNADSCTVNNAPAPVVSSGTYQVSPTATTAYDLNCVSSGGTASSSIIITVGGTGVHEVNP